MITLIPTSCDTTASPTARLQLPGCTVDDPRFVLIEVKGFACMQLVKGQMLLRPLGNMHSACPFYIQLCSDNISVFAWRARPKCIKCSGTGLCRQSVLLNIFSSACCQPVCAYAGFKVYANCPKIGVSIQACTSWWALSGLQPTADFSAVEASVKDISVSITPSGEQTDLCLRTASGNL